MRKVTVYKRWKIYTGFSDYAYSAFLPGMSPSALDVAEWETDNLKELKDFIDWY
jgi:hypothetical protein